MPVPEMDPEKLDAVLRAAWRRSAGMAIAMYVAIVLTVTAIGAFQANQYRMVVNRVDKNTAAVATLICELAGRPGNPNAEDVRRICTEFGVTNSAP